MAGCHTPAELLRHGGPLNGGSQGVNLPLYFLAQLVFTAGTILIVTLGGIVGNAIAPDPAWATLPLSFMVVGTAVATVPTAMLMQRVGRRLGFVVGGCLAVASALLAAWALVLVNFALFTLACGLIGTITHHHAVGRDHMPWYERQVPAPFAAALRAAKAALDPAGILNPGVLTPSRAGGPDG